MAALENMEPRFKSAALNLRFAAGVTNKQDVAELVSLILRPGLSAKDQITFFDSAIEMITRKMEPPKATEAIIEMMDLLSQTPRCYTRHFRACNTMIIKTPQQHFWAPYLGQTCFGPDSKFIRCGSRLEFRFLLTTGQDEGTPPL